MLRDALFKCVESWPGLAVANNGHRALCPCYYSLAIANGSGTEEILARGLDRRAADGLQKTLKKFGYDNVVIQLENAKRSAK